MSGRVEFKIYSGEGSVRYGPNGVILDGFKSTRSKIDRPGDRTFGSVYKWLERGFHINRETTIMTVHVIMNGVSEGVRWELMPIQNSTEWKLYIEKAFQHDWPLVMLVQSYEKVQVERTVHDTEPDEQGGEGRREEEEDPDEQPVQERGDVRELIRENEGTNVTEIVAEGIADEGERIPNIVEGMQNEDEEATLLNQSDDSSDDEDQLMPAEWREQGFGKSTVEDARHTEWEYRGNEVIQGAKYPTLDAVKEAVKCWALSLRKEFRVVRSNSSTYDVRCVKEGCPWRVYAGKGKWKTHWTCSIVVEHTCYSESVKKSHRNLSVSFIANEMHGLIVDNLAYEPKMIIRHIERTFQYSISYIKAWRAKQKVLEMRFGTFEASYNNLPSMLSKIIERNPGSSFDLKHFPNPRGGPNILQRVFFCLGASVRAFQYCVPVLCIDGTFLTGKYKGQILTAVGVDGNNHILPVAFAFVENENTDSWYWFLERVKIQVVAARRDVCLISDRHSGLLAAIRNLKHGYSTYGAIWPDVENRWCMRHMGANFYDHFKNKELMNLFKRLCNQNQQRKFNALWKVLDELTRKQTEDGASSSNTAVQSVESKPFSHWIRDAPKEKWALLYDTNGTRYGIMTTNIAECYNMVMRGVRSLPLVAIVEFILYGCTKYFITRHAAVIPTMNNAAMEFGDRVTEYLRLKLRKAANHSVVPMGCMEHRFEVTCRDRVRRGVHRERIVQECLLRNDGTAACTCHKPRLLHLPCSHVIASCVECGILPYNFVSSYYKKETIVATWTQEVYGIGIFGPFTEARRDVLYVPDPSTKRDIAGRRPSRRIRNGMDESEAARPEKRCSQCNVYGHNYKNCPMNERHGAAETGPSGNANDGRPPDLEPRRRSTSSQARRSIPEQPRRSMSSWHSRP